jgi:hypothetical protein
MTWRSSKRRRIGACLSIHASLTAKRFMASLGIHQSPRSLEIRHGVKEIHRPIICVMFDAPGCCLELIYFDYHFVEQTIAKAVGDWYSGRRQGVKYIDCEYPCNPTCSSLLPTPPWFITTWDRLEIYYVKIQEWRNTTSNHHIVLPIKMKILIIWNENK